MFGVCVKERTACHVAPVCVWVLAWLLLKNEGGMRKGVMDGSIGCHTTTNRCPPTSSVRVHPPDNTPFRRFGINKPGHERHNKPQARPHTQNVHPRHNTHVSHHPHHLALPSHLPSTQHNTTPAIHSFTTRGWRLHGHPPSRAIRPHIHRAWCSSNTSTSRHTRTIHTTHPSQCLANHATHTTPATTV